MGWGGPEGMLAGKAVSEIPEELLNPAVQEQVLPRAPESRTHIPGLRRLWGPQLLLPLEGSRPRLSLSREQSWGVDGSSPLSKHPLGATHC